MSWILGAYTIPEPSQMTVSPVEVIQSRRLASGKLVKDVIAVKRRFRLFYEDLTTEEKETFEAIRDNQQFVNFYFVENGEETEVMVWLEPFSYECACQDPEYWINFDISLEEQ